jgi:deoxyribodipyrimidine photo-lyase
MPSTDQSLNLQERAHPCAVWFRKDLRLDDNRCLLEAYKRSKGRIIPIYILNPKEYEVNLLGWPRCGAYRAQFLLEALNDLKMKFKRLGSDLVIRVGPPEEILPTLADQYGATHLYTLDAQDQHEADTVKAVSEACYREGVEFIEIEGSTLYDYSRLPYEEGELPRDFITFRKELERDASPKPPELAIKKVLPLPMGLRAGKLPKLSSMNLTEFTPDPRSTISFIGGEANGLKRLKDYVWERKLLPYAYTARHGLGGEQISSKLSAWINLGCLSPRRVWYEVLAYEAKHGGSQGTYQMVYHLTMRDYMIFHAKQMGDKLYDLKGLKEIPKVWEEDSDRFALWWQGYSGFPLIDAFMRELSSTGYISPRGRQLVSAFFVQHLKLPWTWAASCLETLLIDYHPAITWGAMQSVAGLGVKLPTQSVHPIESGYAVDWEGAFVRYWIPELANLPSEYIYQPHHLSEEHQAHIGLILGQQYPYPIVEPPPPSEREPTPRERHHELIMDQLKRFGRI